MTMYYQYQGGSEIQADDGLQTLYLMNPNYFQNQPNPNTPFLTPAPIPLHPLHAPPPPLLTGVPLSRDPSRPSPIPLDYTAPRAHYNTWETSLNHHQHRSDYGNSNQANTPQQNQTARGMSLSLSPHSKPNALAGNHDHFPAGKITLPENNCSSENLAGKSDYTAESVIRGSKYLRAAREVLDEVVGVGKGPKDKAKIVKDSIAAPNKVSHENSEDGDNNGGANHELTSAQRQEILMKKAKLTTMLHEVEQRCRHYHHQMQIIVASFEQAAGPGSAKSYTHLALKTILKQFKCLKNTIAAQIMTLSKSLGENTENSKANIILEGSRLKFIDHHLWQQIRPSSSQQLGNNNNNNNAWRPQRGLPEKAVSVLRAWLFEHFLHPYPKDSDKHMLAKQTGLTRSQVSNWFINARVRLWKPMIEDMYLDEIKNQETNNLDDKNTTKTNTHSNPNPKSNQPQSTNTTTISSTTQNDQNSPEKFNPKKPRNKNFQDNSPLISPSLPHNNMGTQKHMEYLPISKGLDDYLSPFGFSSTYEYPDHRHRQISSGLNFPGNNNSFSLTLGPPPSETYSQGENRQNFFSGFEFGERIVEPVERNDRGIVGISDHQAQVSCPNIVDYEAVHFQDRRKPFPAQLLPGHFGT